VSLPAAVQKVKEKDFPVNNFLSLKQKGSKMELSFINQGAQSTNGI
jgi:hypothetical protein